MSTPELRLVYPPASSVADADTPRGEAFHYWAFVSYSHRDAKVASTLQRALETYRLPRRLVGRTTAQGAVPPFVKPVFRDRDELPAGTDLKTTVRDALASSRWLVVVCSPSAAQSPWVNREIAEFKKLHGEARVLAVIVGGEPFASRLPGREGEECFPEALRFALAPDGKPQGESLEPIAVDLRPQGDRKRLALLKLVAGMTGVGVDELARRDAQRRARRLAWVALGASVGMLVMAVLTVMAVQARNEAQRQRAQAEDMIEFMLGDLRRKLEPVGRLDVLDAVGEKALAHYAAQRADALDANELGRRARALHLIGEIREKRGNLDEALKAFRSAADTTAQLLERAPNDGQRIFDHAQSVYWVGYVAWLRRQAGDAETAFRKYHELAQRLVQIDSKRPDWRVEIAYATQNLAVVYLDSSRPAEALKTLSATREAYLSVVAEQPDLNFDFSNAYGWIATAHEALGDFSAAIDSQRAKIEVLTKVPNADKDRRVQRLSANANYEIGRLQLILADAAAAQRSARMSVEQFDALTASDSSNLDWLHQACFARYSLVDTELALGNLATARSILERASADTLRLMAADASRLAWHVALRGRSLELAATIAMAENRAFPSKDLEDYLVYIRGVESAGKVLSDVQSLVVAAAELTLGNLLARSGHVDQATPHWQSVTQRVQGLAGQGNARALTLLALAQLRLRQVGDARALAARIGTTKYRHPDYAALVTELAH